MPNQSRDRLYQLGVAVLIGFACLCALRTGSGQAERGAAQITKTDQRTDLKVRDDQVTPIVDFDRPATLPKGSDLRRYEKNSRFDKRGLVKAEVDPGVGEVRVSGPPLISDIPSNISDLVVEGEVTDSSAFLSNDRGMVYSEFTVLVSNVLKNGAGELEIKQGDLVVTERLGGRVRYPDGQIVRYRISAQGSPEKAKRYVFFLMRAGQGNYTIVTAYEVAAGKVFALDGSRTSYQGRLIRAVDNHNDEDYDRFREAVEDAIKNP